MEDSKLSNVSSKQSGVKKLRVKSPGRVEKGRNGVSADMKLNAMKAKVFYKQMQKLRKSPEINKVSRQLVRSKLSASPPKSPYVRRILSGNKFIKSVSTQSTTSFVSAVESPRFLVLSMKKKQDGGSSSGSIQNLLKSDIFTRSVQLLKRREKALEEVRNLKKDEGLDQCTFKPNLSKRSYSSCRSLSVKSVKSSNTSYTQEPSKVVRYTSLSPTPRIFSFKEGCDLKPVKERSSPMFRYLAVRMPLI